MNEDLTAIVGENELDNWLKLDTVKLFYKDTVPYGAVGTYYNTEDGYTYVASTTIDVDSDFTVAQLRHCVKLYLDRPTCFISGTPHRHHLIQGLMDRLEFRYTFVDGVLFAYSTNHTVKGYNEV